MPPGRPRKSASAATAAQKPLCFGPNKSNKITKPSIAHPPSKLSQSKNASPSLSLEKAIVAEIPPSSLEPIDIDNAKVNAVEEAHQKATLAIRKQAPAPQTTSNSAIEEKAAKIPDTQIRKYWQGKEEERIAPRVHQQGLSVNEKVLRHFDLSSQFGPCIGIPRMKRWKRADRLKLKPPIEVLAVLMKEERNKNIVAERAFMDGLLTSRLAVNE